MSKVLILAAFVAVTALAPFAAVSSAHAFEDCGFSTKCGPNKKSPPLVDCGFSTTCGPNKKKPVALGRVKPVMALGRVKPALALGRVQPLQTASIPTSTSMPAQKEKHYENKEHSRNQQHVSMATSSRRHR